MNEVEKEKLNQTVKVGDLFNNMLLTKNHFFVGFVLFITSVIEAWEMMLIIFVSPSIANDFQLSDLQIGSIIGSIYLGMIPSSYIWGIISDRIGRKKSLIYSLLGFSIISALSAFSINFEMLYALRFAAGVALGGVMVAGYPYFEEMLPVKQRGRGIVYLSAGWPLGTLIALGITSLLLERDGLIGGWRTVLILSSLVSLWTILLRKIPESPYWLVAKGKQEEAKKSIAYLSMGQMEVRENENLWIQPIEKGNYFSIFKNKLLKITTYQTIVNFAFAFGYWGLYTWLPTLLAQRGLALSASLTFLAISTLFQIPSYLIASPLTGRYGRKKVMIVFVLLSVICGFGFAYSSNMIQMYSFYFGLSFFSLGAWGVWNAWFGEIYPTNSRSIGYSFGAGAQRWANAFAPSIIGLVIGMGWAFGQTISFVQAFVVITLITIMFIPETEGEILE
ncbi:MFS transporter [Peribacillus sp. FSL E2-0159]|uniref:MFS transporter n=1 Tax=Peribacillus sp. FSL E2-0159 TaxID=2975289 RepID=UPI003159F0FE